MIKQNFVPGHSFLARLDHGADLMEQIAALAREEGIKAGTFQVIGALMRSELGYFDQVQRQYRKVAIEEPMELVSCLGNISLRDGEPFVHAHAVLGNRDGKLWGGHLNKGTIFAAELHLQELAGPPLNREYDPVTGLFLWSHGP